MESVSSISFWCSAGLAYFGCHFWEKWKGSYKHLPKVVQPEPLASRPPSMKVKFGESKLRVKVSSSIFVNLTASPVTGSCMLDGTVLFSSML